MLKNICLSFLLLCFCYNSKAAPPLVKPDSLLNIQKLNDQNLRERKLISYLQSFFEVMPINSFNTAKAEMDGLLLKYNVENKPAFNYFIESIYQNRLLHINEAENALIKGIELAGENADHYLLFAFFTHLAFLQTYQGNTIEAVSSFRLAKKEAITLNDAYLEVLVDVNISDIYYRNNFYGQSLFYLNQAYSTLIKHQINEQRLKNVIYNNKAENYFRMNEADSLAKYNQMLHDAKSGTYKLYIFRKRTDYYLSLLHHDYKAAIKHIIALQHDTLYRYDDTDQQNLANAYYNAGMPDSAKYIINQLLAKPEQNNHPEIKLHLYQVLGGIAEKENDYKQAAYNFKMALQQSEDHIGRLTQVGNISSQIKLDEVQGSYTKRVWAYKRQRTWLIFIVIVALLTIAVVAMFYRNTKQKRYYERLLYATKQEELAFIHSHEVRRHLSNILGIIDMIKHSENKAAEYLHAEDHLFCAAESLDAAIKNISEKLDS
jgi:hypothetical protein